MKAIREEYYLLRDEIFALKQQLGESVQKKETAFSEKSGFASKAISMVAEIKELRKKRDVLTAEVRQIKLTRDAAHAKLNELRTAAAALQKEKKQLMEKYGITRSLAVIAQQIRHIESKIETEIISFAAEQQLMRQLRDLKKEKEQQQVLADVNNRLREVYGKIKATREEADAAHALTKAKAVESQGVHEQMVALSKEIDRCDEQQKVTVGVHQQHKDAIRTLRAELNEKMDILEKLSDELDFFYDGKKNFKKQREEEMLAQKEKQIEKKILRREKLTTADLLIYQQQFSDS